MKYLQLKLKIKYQNKKLDGTPRKLLDSSLAKKYGWKAKISLEEGIGFAINDFIEKYIQNAIFTDLCLKYLPKCDFLRKLF